MAKILQNGMEEGNSMFVGRKKELAKLRQLYDGDQFQCVILYGRRRIGKTTLIREFIKGRKAVYFAGMETTEQNNLESFSRSIFEISMEGEAMPSFRSFEDAFAYAAQLAKAERLILVIDEFPYLANTVKGISSVLQKFIDLHFLQTRLFLILCGSSMSFMENQVLGYQSPLYGRRTAQFRIEPFDFFEARLFHPSLSISDAALIYGLTGGVPQYLVKINESKSMKENIIDNFLTPDSYLFEEPSNLLKQELREPQLYNAIISAIAAGSSRLNEIATRTGLSTSAAVQYLNSLMSLGIVKKEFPVTEQQSRKTIYRIADNMFRFWYRFVPKNYSRIQNGLADKVYASMEAELSDYMGAVFENICIQYMWRLYSKGNVPFDIENVGRWWGNNPGKRSEQEIDILAIGSNKAVFGECKWRNEPMDTGDYAALKEKTEMFPYNEKYYYLFSKSGFTKELRRQTAGDVELRLIGLEEIGG
jgi:AAA+ ATPase superfamily predicted ATPase